MILPCRPDADLRPRDGVLRLAVHFARDIGASIYLAGATSRRAGIRPPRTDDAAAVSRAFMPYRSCFDNAVIGGAYYWFAHGQVIRHASLDFMK